MAKARTRSKKSTSKKKSSARKKSGAKKTSRSKTRKKAVTKKKTTRGAKKSTSRAKKKATKKKVTKKRVTKKKVAKKTTSKAKAAKKKTSKAKAKVTSKALKKSGKAAAGKKKATAKAAAKGAKPAKAAMAKARAKAETAPAEPEEVRITVEEAMANLPYSEGEHVVHPKYGLGTVARILDRTLSTRTVPCLEITFPFQEMKLTIPVDQLDRSGLRPPIAKKNVEGVFKVLKGRATFDAKRRSAKRVVDYRKRLNVGDPTSLAEAVRDLARLSLKKSLSYEERKILSTALRILSREVALARGREAEEVREEIEKIVYR